MSISQTNSSVEECGAKPPSSPFVSPRVPSEVDGIQHNFCKNNQCVQFGLIPSDQPNKRGGPNFYSFVSGGKKYPLLKCNACSESPPLKSNLGISQEIKRLTAYLTPKVFACTNEMCENHTVPLGTKKAYRAFGLSKAGAQRYQCAKCRKTFSVPKPTQYQHDTHHNKMIFKMLVNKVPLRRIVAMLDINWEVLYNRIDFIHRQCLAFASHREARLRDMPIKRLYLALDRQDHQVNWTERQDKRNVILSCIASADNTTGYVFGIHPNFDATVDREAVEADALACGDIALPPPHRKYAHLWLADDYVASSSKSTRKPKAGSTLEKTIANIYDESANRDDIDVFDNKTNEQKLPDYGLQVHAEYTMAAHFHFLKQLMRNVDKWRFFMDQESGIRSAFFGAFIGEIKAHLAEGFYVSCAKDLSVDEKRALINQSNKEFRAFMAQHPELKENEAKLQILKQRIANMSEIGKWRDRWVQHPMPNMGEAEKSMCWLTPHTEFDEDHVAMLYNKASLHSVDAFFEKIRRRISMFERPVHSASADGRTWSGYAAYNPGQAVKLLEIFRVVHNYIDTRKTKGVLTTPAMRIGLAQAPIDYGDVIYFQGMKFDVSI